MQVSKQLQMPIKSKFWTSQRCNIIEHQPNITCKMTMSEKSYKFLIRAGARRLRGQKFNSLYDIAHANVSLL
jgi:hypothetical protein